MIIHQAVGEQVDPARQKIPFGLLDEEPTMFRGEEDRTAIVPPIVQMVVSADGVLHRARSPQSEATP